MKTLAKTFAASALAFAALFFGTRKAGPTPGQPEGRGYPTQDLGAGLQDLGAGIQPQNLGQPGQPVDFAGQALEKVFAAPARPQIERYSNLQWARNRDAFLMAIRAAEGTAKPGGYGALFGWPAIPGRTFDPFTVADHPRQFFDYTDKAGKAIKTSAAGAYQIVYTTWRDERPRFARWAAQEGKQIHGFTPDVQDAFALYLLDRDGALAHVLRGHFDAAVLIARRRWASLPGANVNQPERSRDFVFAAYRKAGGVEA